MVTLLSKSFLRLWRWAVPFSWGDISARAVCCFITAGFVTIKSVTFYRFSAFGLRSGVVKVMFCLILKLKSSQILVRYSELGDFNFNFYVQTVLMSFHFICIIKCS